MASQPLLAAEPPNPSKFPTLAPNWEQTICRWSAAHPRHDHQLIFPLSAGRLIFVWSEYCAEQSEHLARKSPADAGGFGDEMPCRLSAMISSDRGRTWGEPWVLQENRWKLNVKHPNLLRLKSGEILLTFSAWDSLAQRNILARRSADEGETWTEPEPVSGPGWFCTNNDHVLRLTTGRIVLPAHSVIGGGPYQGSKSKLEAFAFLSDDEGRTWKRSAGAMTAVGRGCHEPSMIERKDGRLLCYLRNTNTRIYQSVSEDGGNRWSVPESTELPAPESPALLKRIPRTGDLLLVWNRVPSKTGSPRTPLTVAISKDDGETWGHVRHVESSPGTDAAYASAWFQDDEVLIAYYSRDRRWSRDSEITLRAYKLDQLYADG